MARAAGTYIALLGGLLVVADAFVETIVMWTMLQPGILHDPNLVLALYLSGLPSWRGFSVPMDPFLAGVSVTAAFMHLLPKWVIALGLVLAAAGEISWLHLALPQLLFLIPIVRFPGFVWLIAVGFLLPKTRGTPVRETLSAA